MNHSKTERSPFNTLKSSSKSQTIKAHQSKEKKAKKDSNKTKLSVNKFKIYTEDILETKVNGKKLNRGNEEYIKTIKQAIHEILNENDIVKFIII